jgi:hypothetical protein
MSTDTPAPPRVKYCFSGSGKPANRKWAPGGDATYLSRLRKAHLANETLPDPWYIQEHGGIEANAPEDGWPELSAMDIAISLDNERGPAASPHWVHTLENSAAINADRMSKRAQRAATAAERAKARAEAKAAQAARPKEGDEGEWNGQHVVVIRRLDPERILVKTDDNNEELIFDNEFLRPEAEAEAETETEAEDEETFTETE